MLSKENRLKKKRDFDLVIKRGKGIGGDFLNLRFLKNNLKETRIGFVVGQRVSKKAVERNKIKRRLREIAGKYLSGIKSGYDLIFFSKKGIEKQSLKEVRAKMEFLFKRGKLFKNG